VIRTPIAIRLEAEAPLALGAVLHRALDRAQAVAQTLEFEAADPRVAELHGRARDLQRDIAGLLVAVAADEVGR
jgi:hypothetical protein